MSEIAYSPIRLQSVNTAPEARQHLKAMERTGLVGFVMDLSGVTPDLSPENPIKIVRTVHGIVGRTLGSLGFGRNDYVDFGPNGSGARDFPLHLDSFPDGSANHINAYNVHVTVDGEHDVFLVPTTDAYWEAAHSEIPETIARQFAAGIIDDTLFGPVYSARVRAPALVVHQLAGRLPVAHRYRTIGPGPRHSLAITYEREVKSRSAREILGEFCEWTTPA